MQNNEKIPQSVFKRLNQPEPIKVRENPGGEPAALLGSSTRPVESIEDTWRIDDEWWGREPISRIYFNVILTSGQRLTIFKDVISGTWYRQQY